MPDRLFSEAEQAALYDLLSPPRERDDFRYYLPMIMAAPSVLDIGCGTGALLHMAREAGHTGRLVGLDPAEGMIAQARRRSDIDWALGDLGSVRFEREFDLAVMTGHAFQVLLTDEEVRQALASVRSALTDGGRFSFETRNPAVRAWERWTPEHGKSFTDAAGAQVRWETDVESVAGERGQEVDHGINDARVGLRCVQVVIAGRELFVEAAALHRTDGAHHLAGVGQIYSLSDPERSSERHG
jgi:SAM-dependent methyltransferase